VHTQLVVVAHRQRTNIWLAICDEALAPVPPLMATVPGVLLFSLYEWVGVSHS
jgi:hypothetical protein